MPTRHTDTKDVPPLSPPHAVDASIVQVIPRAARIVVTGGAGFIGSHLVDALLKLGLHVSVIDDFNGFYSPQTKRANVAPHLSNQRYALFEGDIRQADFVSQVFEKTRPDQVIHLAARAGVRPSLDQWLLYEQTNVIGTLNVLAACHQVEVKRFILGSSSSVYGINPDIPFRESDAILRPISPYAVTKAAAEMHTHAFTHLHGIPAVVLRFFTVYGPRQRPDLAIHKFARLIREGAPIPLYGDGSTQRDYTYVSDIVGGILAAMDYSGSTYEIFNLGNARTVSLQQLVQSLEKALGRAASYEQMPQQPGDVPRTFADISKAQRLLDYQPDTPLDEGLANFVAWLDQSGQYSGSMAIPQPS